MNYVKTDETGKVIGASDALLSYCNEPVNNWSDVAEHFNADMEGVYVRDGIATFEPTERDQEIIAERTAKAQREAKLAAIVDSYGETLEPSDKLGQLWKVVKLGDVEIMREYVPDPNYTDDADGTYLKPFAFTPGMSVDVGMWYTDGENIWECVQGGTADAFTAPWFDVIG